jgi:hypothetical protein
MRKQSDETPQSAFQYEFCLLKFTTSGWVGCGRNQSLEPAFAPPEAASFSTLTI